MSRRRERFGLQHAVHVVQEEDLAHAEEGGGLSLLGLPDGGQALRGHRGILTAFVAPGGQTVDHLVSFLGPAGDGPAGSEFGIIGMRHHHQDAHRVPPPK